MDSQIPNRVFEEWARQGGIPGLDGLRREQRYGQSRFDFFLELGDRGTFAEVKGVTLEEDGIAMFPDAPTERGVKHLRELCDCVRAGYGAMVVFIIQMKGVRWFAPNDCTHLAFGEALREARRSGVEVLALDCDVTPGSIVAKDPVEIRL
jgi:sugar fermentation stimulation protein A